LLLLSLLFFSHLKPNHIYQVFFFSIHNSDQHYSLDSPSLLLMCKSKLNDGSIVFIPIESPLNGQWDHCEKSMKIPYFDLFRLHNV
jgi:hypothetical protein